MTEQTTLNLDCAAYARVSDPGTSHAAAESIKGRNATELEAKVLMALVKRENIKGLTTHEIALVTGLEYGSVTPRIRPLVKQGRVVDSGERRIPAGRTKAGIVWKAVTASVLMMLSSGCDKLDEAPEANASTNHIMQVVDRATPALSPNYWIYRDSRNGDEYLVIRDQGVGITLMRRGNQ